MENVTITHERQRETLKTVHGYLILNKEYTPAMLAWRKPWDFYNNDYKTCINELRKECKQNDGKY